MWKTILLVIGCQQGFLIQAAEPFRTALTRKQAFTALPALPPVLEGLAGLNVGLVEGWGLSGRARSIFFKKHPKEVGVLWEVLNYDMVTKTAWDNWGLYAYGKGKSGEGCGEGFEDEFTYRFPRDSAILAAMLTAHTGSRLVAAHYADINYRLGCAAHRGVPVWRH